VKQVLETVCITAKFQPELCSRFSLNLKCFAVKTWTWRPREVMSLVRQAKDPGFRKLLGRAELDP